MEVLSLQDSVLALLEACSKASRTFAKTRPLRDASGLLQAVKNETSDLQLMLMDIDDRLERIESSRVELSRVNRAIFRLSTSIIDRTKDRILEVDSLIQDHLSAEKNNTGEGANRRVFRQGYSKLARFQTELQELRQRVGDICKALGAQNMSRIEVTLNDSRSSDSAMLFQRQDKMQKQLRHLVNPQSIVSSSSKLAQGKPQASGNTSSNIEISVSRLSPAVSSSIQCTCSRQGASTYLQTLLGALFLGYATTPILRTNKQKCLYHRRQTEVRIAYFFPSWFIEYVIWLQIQFSMNGPLQCTLSCIQIIPRDHVVLDMIQYGDVEGIKSLLVSGTISIKAQMQNGASLLHVSSLMLNSNYCWLLIPHSSGQFGMQIRRPRNFSFQQELTGCMNHLIICMHTSLQI